MQHGRYMDANSLEMITDFVKPSNKAQEMLEKEEVDPPPHTHTQMHACAIKTVQGLV